MVVIPARLASTRLPGKVLSDIGGVSMLGRVCANAMASRARSVLVATDDRGVAAEAERHGVRARMTRAAHRSGTERIAEVVDALEMPDGEIVVNVQADEPLLPAKLIDQVAGDLAAHPEASIATLCSAIEDGEVLGNPSVVKVVRDAQGYALYFSRAPIPWERERPASGAIPEPRPGLHWRHIGIYAYRAAYLRTHRALGECVLERVECLEQLRALAAGYRIHVVPAEETPGPGVDTAEDLAAVRRLLAPCGQSLGDAGR